MPDCSGQTTAMSARAQDFAHAHTVHKDLEKDLSAMAQLRDKEPSTNRLNTDAINTNPCHCNTTRFETLDNKSTEEITEQSEADFKPPYSLKNTMPL